MGAPDINSQGNSLDSTSDIRPGGNRHRENRGQRDRFVSGVSNRLGVFCVEDRVICVDCEVSGVSVVTSFKTHFKSSKYQS